MIILPLSHDTAWTTLEPLMSTYPWGEHSRPGKLTEDELDAHNREFHSGPVPLGYEAGEIIDIDKLDDAQPSDFVTLPAELTSKRTEPMAWLVAVPLTCTALYVVWSILAILWRIVSKVIL